MRKPHFATLDANIYSLWHGFRATYCKMSLECLWSSICMITTYLAIITDVQSMKLVQPVRNGLEQKSITEYVETTMTDNILNDTPFFVYVQANKTVCHIHMFPVIY